MHTPINITAYGHQITVTVATTAESHSHFTENPDTFLRLVQDIRNILRNVETVVVR